MTMKSTHPQLHANTSTMTRRLCVIVSQTESEHQQSPITREVKAGRICLGHILHVECAPGVPLGAWSPGPEQWKGPRPPSHVPKWTQTELTVLQEVCAEDPHLAVFETTGKGFSIRGFKDVPVVLIVAQEGVEEQAWILIDVATRLWEQSSLLDILAGGPAQDAGEGAICRHLQPHWWGTLQGHETYSILPISNQLSTFVQLEKNSEKGKAEQSSWPTLSAIPWIGLTAGALPQLEGLKRPSRCNWLPCASSLCLRPQSRTQPEGTSSQVQRAFVAPPSPNIQDLNIHGFWYLGDKPPRLTRAHL